MQTQVQKPMQKDPRNTTSARNKTLELLSLALLLLRPLLHDLEVAPLLALFASDDSTSAHLRDVSAKILGVDGWVVETGLDDV
jgi:hypothetical protein